MTEIDWQSRALAAEAAAAARREAAVALADAAHRAGNVLFNLKQDSGPGSVLAPDVRKSCREAQEALDAAHMRVNQAYAKGAGAALLAERDRLRARVAWVIEYSETDTTLSDREVLDNIHDGCVVELSPGTALKETSNG